MPNSKTSKHQEIPVLSPDKIRKAKGFENLTDKEADNIAASLKELSLITYQIFERENKSKAQSSDD